MYSRLPKDVLNNVASKLNTIINERPISFTGVKNKHRSFAAVLSEDHYNTIHGMKFENFNLLL